MNEVRKLPASAGAEWLLGGFSLLRRAPLGLGVLGVLYGAISLLVGLSIQHSTSLFMLLEVVLALIGPVVIGGMVYAAREVDRGNNAVPGHLLQGVRDGKLPRLLATLLPQVGAFVLIVLLLALLVGFTEVASLATAMEKLQGQAQPDPALLAGFPVVRLLVWLLLAFAIGILASFFTFVGLPEIMLTDSDALPAMIRSFRACLRNLPALVVFFIVTCIAMFALYFALMLVALLVRAVAGAMAMQVVLQLLLMAVLLPVVTGAMYVAWQQMLGDRPASATPATSGFEA